MGSRGPGEANRLFPQSVLLQPPLTHGAARRRAGSHGKKGTNKKKTTTLPHKSHCLWKVDGEKAGGGKKEGEQNKLTGGLKKKKAQEHNVLHLVWILTATVGSDPLT